jgi:thiosulfate/3-mercaptopyruvate sulfurtransferase
MTDVAIEELAARLGEVAVLDVRTVSEYDGSGGSHCDPRQGHIPGALHIDVTRLTELEAPAIRERLGIEPGGEVVVYCHSGSRSAIAAQLLRGLGYDARNYVGSWHEWSRHDELPLET